jgi:tetratricopeptide (TPR) repeat protein
MRWIPLLLALVGLAASASANDPVVDPAAAAAPEAPQASPELVRLDRKLVQILEARDRGRVEPDRYRDFLIGFRADLRSARAATAPSPVNEALHARILSRLGDRDEAASALMKALGKNPNVPALVVALGQVRYDERKYSAALVEANAALKLDPSNREALTLKHFSEGRIDAENADAGPERGSVSRKIRVARLDPAKLPYKLPVKIARGGAPPELVVVHPDSSPKGPGPMPLLSLAGAASLGFAAFGVARSRRTYESEDGLDDAHPYPYGRGQRFVAGALLAAMAAASLYSLGAAVVSAAPVAVAFATNVGSQSLRLAGSEVGAINPGAVSTMNAVPGTLARVIAYSPGQELPEILGLPGKSQAFVTAAEDVEGLTAQQLEEKLGILPSSEYLIIRFPAPPAGLATPIEHIDPQFVGEGLTSGGAREFLIPNGPVPAGATFEIVK